MRKYLYLSAVCVCMALCFVGCSKDDDEPGGKGAMYEVTIEQSGDFRSFIKSVVVVANGTRLKDGATGESLASPLILSDEELAVEKVTKPAGVRCRRASSFRMNEVSAGIR